MTTPTRPARGTGRSRQVRPASTTGRPSWPVVAGLIALIAFPTLASALRVIEVTAGVQLLPENPRITASPAPLVVHVTSAVVFAVAGAWQFPGRFRSRHRGGHRTAGRVVVGAGLVVAITGLWMTLFYANAPGGVPLWTV